MVIQLLDKTLYGIIMVGKGSLFGVLLKEHFTVF